MFVLFARLLKDQAGFSAIEYGLMAALGLIMVGQLVASKF
jgi:Flp pilus assembly pilin Flp